MIRQQRNTQSVYRPTHTNGRTRRPGVIKWTVGQRDDAVGLASPSGAVLVLLDTAGHHVT